MFYGFIESKTNVYLHYDVGNLESDSARKDKREKYRK